MRYLIRFYRLNRSHSPALRSQCFLQLSQPDHTVQGDRVRLLQPAIMLWVLVSAMLKAMAAGVQGDIAARSVILHPRITMALLLDEFQINMLQ